jgi:hypothetical protein
MLVIRNASRLAMAVAIGVCLWGRGTVSAAGDPPAATPRPTFTEEEQEILNKLLFHTDAQPDDGPAPLTVHFSAEPFETDNPVHPKYVWNFGDGSPEVKGGPTAKHTYKKPGRYKATLKVTADGGQAGGDDFDITVEKPE